MHKYITEIKTLTFFDAESGEELFKFDPVKAISVEEIREWGIIND